VAHRRRGADAKTADTFRPEAGQTTRSSTGLDELQGEGACLDEAVAAFGRLCPAETSTLRQELDAEARRFLRERKTVSAAPRCKALAEKFRELSRAADALARRFVALSDHERSMLLNVAWYTGGAPGPFGAVHLLIPDGLRVSRPSSSQPVDLLTRRDLDPEPDGPDGPLVLAERLSGLAFAARAANRAVPKDRGGRTNSVRSMSRGSAEFSLAVRLAWMVERHRLGACGKRAKPELRVSGTPAGVVYRIAAQYCPCRTNGAVVKASLKGG
jgi:hypothetical protein